MKVRIVVILFIVILLIVISIVVFNRINHIPPHDAQVLENEGQVCFAPSSDGYVVRVYSGGCFSSVCTNVYERTGDILFNNDKFIIQIESRFVAVDTKGKTFIPGFIKYCTADCEGVGWLEFATSELVPGTYSVMHGEETIGFLQIPIQEQQSVCFDGQ